MHFLKYKVLYFTVSLLVIIPGLISMTLYGFKPSIDFVGGSSLEVQFLDGGTLSTETAQQILSETYAVNSVQQSGTAQFILKGETITNDQKNTVLQQLESIGPVTELRFETVGPTLSRELLIKMLTAVVLVAVLITLYIWKQFSELRYGVSAILAMVHDTLVLLGVFSLLGQFFGVEVDVLFVTAVLTTLSFSVHDTIVVYDRIRELRRKHPRVEYDTLLDAAVLETLSRSLNNSVTIILMLLILTLLGGESIRYFALALLVGAVTGTYSSPFTAVPLLSVWEEIKKKRARTSSN